MRIGRGRITRNRTSAENAGIITVLGVQTEIVEVDVGEVSTGDMVLVTTTFGLAKGGTLGTSAVTIRQSGGTATGVFVKDQLNIWSTHFNVPASTFWVDALSTVYQVTGGGTLLLALDGLSSGSNSIVNPGVGQIHAWTIYGGI